ncbi:MAG: hypothetical protein P4L40_00015 [Terracidiphilus sp.]|nr:hypothetical protein [Terracidiphilus sp.]
MCACVFADAFVFVCVCACSEGGDAEAAMWCGPTASAVHAAALTTLRSLLASFPLALVPSRHSLGLLTWPAHILASVCGHGGTFSPEAAAGARAALTVTARALEGQVSECTPLICQ